MSRCLCLSITSGCCIETDGRINLLFEMEASFDLSCAVFMEIQVSLQE